MAIWLFLLFVVLPFVELALLLVLADVTSWWWTLVLIVVTGSVGMWLARAQGGQAWRRIQSELAAGRMPADSLLDALMILVAGILLLTPGILTDALGLSLLIPRCRRLYRKWLIGAFKSRVATHYASFTSGPPDRGESQVIDSYVVGRTPEEQ